MTEKIQPLTKADLEAAVADVEYQRFGETCTVCALVLKSGFVVIGKSACLLPSMFDEEVGRKMAYEDAVNQMWALEGYRAKTNQYADLMLAGG
ncbi:Gp49 family protein [Neisseria shayeganii]|uniref:Uncharacterized protein n=1 Tax=Neisseria shayeganii 871 TaxID=1032488 RepID=G4CJG3_9NEIS|nr:Gp49 family protein [Neisseria shayeganii]EGY52014.1 hypothetical protein HMPREF9371_1753 [Neisseria shayeganii 871]